MKRIWFLPICTCAAVLAGCSYISGGGDVIRRILGVSEPPAFVSVSAVSATEAVFEFSKPVTVESVRLSPEMAAEVAPPADGDDGSAVRVTFAAGLAPGERVTAELVASDADGNTVHVIVPFRTRNDRIPELVINELRTEFSRPRAEFIEMRMRTAGNLGALRLFIASNAGNPLVYEFPSVEVAAGEFVTLHLRLLEEASRDELGTNLAESGGTDSSPTARDLWVPVTSKLLRRTDIVYLLDQDGRVVDAVVLSETAGDSWGRSNLEDAAAFLLREGAWRSADGIAIRPSDAVRTASVTATRTVNRDERLLHNSRSPADWYITATRGATPGRPNNPARHNP